MTGRLAAARAQGWGSNEQSRESSAQTETLPRVAWCGGDRGGLKRRAQPPPAGLTRCVEGEFPRRASMVDSAGNVRTRVPGARRFFPSRAPEHLIGWTGVGTPPRARKLGQRGTRGLTRAHHGTGGRRGDDTRPGMHTRNWVRPQPATPGRLTIQKGSGNALSRLPLLDHART